MLSLSGYAPFSFISDYIHQTTTIPTDQFLILQQFDDLGFGDTGYNGATYPTPILDELANNDAIKINFHYTEQVCEYHNRYI